MNTWSVQLYDDTIDKKLRKFKSNKPLIKKFKNFIVELESTDDPADIGTKNMENTKIVLEYT